MSEESRFPKQKLDAGGQSHNIQVGRDFHHHEAPKQSLLYRPDQGDVEKFDPRFRRIREAADKVVSLRSPLRITPMRLSSLGLVLKLILFAILIGFLIAAILNS